MHTQQRTPKAPQDRALVMRGTLLHIAGLAASEATRCSHVLSVFDPARARECRELARRATALAESILEWREPSTTQERRLADALEVQAIVQESSRLELEASERPTPAD